MQLLSINPTEDLLPFFAIFFTFMVPIAVIYFYYKHKSRVMDERRLMIEKGLTPPPIKESFEIDRSKTPLAKGLNMIAIALGLLIGYYVSRHYDIRGPFAIAGGILFFLGIANIIIAMIKEPNQDSSHLNKNNEQQ
jgi:Domain of unknown function (DUF6249)